MLDFINFGKFPEYLSSDIIHKKLMKKETKPNAKIELEDLALMVQKGFQEQSRELREFKEEMHDFRDEMYEFKNEVYGFKFKTEGSIFEIQGNTKNIYGKLDSIDDTLEEIRPLLKVLKYNDRDLDKRATKIEHQLKMA